MKKIFKNYCLMIISSALILILVNCSGSETKTEDYTVEKNVKVGKTPDLTKAETGKKIFTEKCAACHKYDTRLVGPPLRDVTKRRSYDYIISQILHPDLMIKNNDTTKALLAKYLTQMPNQHLSYGDALNVLEHLRVVSTESAIK